MSAGLCLLRGWCSGAPTTHRSPRGEREPAWGETGPADSARWGPHGPRAGSAPWARCGEGSAGARRGLSSLSVRAWGGLGLANAFRRSQSSGLSCGPREASWAWLSCTWAGGVQLASLSQQGGSGLRPRGGDTLEKIRSAQWGEGLGQGSSLRIKCSEEQARFAAPEGSRRSS